MLIVGDVRPIPTDATADATSLARAEYKGEEFAPVATLSKFQAAIVKPQILCICGAAPAGMRPGTSIPASRLMNNKERKNPRTNRLDRIIPCILAEKAERTRLANKSYGRQRGSTISLIAVRTLSSISTSTNSGTQTTSMPSFLR